MWWPYRVTIGPLALLFCGLFFYVVVVAFSLSRVVACGLSSCVSVRGGLLPSFFLYSPPGIVPYDPMDQLRVSAFNRYLPTERENENPGNNKIAPI